MKNSCGSHLNQSPTINSFFGAVWSFFEGSYSGPYRWAKCCRPETGLRLLNSIRSAWVTCPPKSSARRLIDQLSRISDLQKDAFEQLNDDDLIGFGAVIAFLLQMGIRDEAGLKANLAGYRNTLIVEVAGKCGYQGTTCKAAEICELVQLALEAKPSKTNSISGAACSFFNSVCSAQRNLLR